MQTLFPFAGDGVDVSPDAHEKRNEAVTVRLDRAICERLDRWREERGLTRAEAIRHLLSVGFADPPEGPAPQPAYKAGFGLQLTFRLSESERARLDAHVRFRVRHSFGRSLSRNLVIKEILDHQLPGAITK